MAAARFAGDSLSARHGAASLVRSGSLLSMCGLALALFIPHQAVALVGFAAVGAGFATIVPQVFSAAGRIPGVASGPAIATATTVGYSGFLVGPPAIGFAAQHFGLRAALSLVVISTALAILLAPSVNAVRETPRPD
jgi:MFS family permease